MVGCRQCVAPLGQQLFDSWPGQGFQQRLRGREVPVDRRHTEFGGPRHLVELQWVPFPHETAAGIEDALPVSDSVPA